MVELNKNLNILIMAGGSGTRFWPKSRSKKPKQLLCLWDDKTLIEHTVERFIDLVSEENIWIVTTQAILQQTQTVLSRFKKIKYLAEPTGKNTAPCIYWGVCEIEKTNPNAKIAVMPADHFIGDKKTFLNTVETAVLCSEKNNSIVTIGIKPSHPETGYGYIEFSENNSGKATSVKRFVEKPDLRTAVQYLNSGKFLWNAGMFVFTVETAKNAFLKCMPELVKSFANLDQGIDSVYSKIDKENAQSVDYGVMEKSLEQNIPVDVISVDCGWNDLGSFPALEEINCAIQGNVVTHEAGSNIVISDHGVVGLLGVSDLIVVRDGDVVMVSSKERAQDIKKLLEKVKIKFPNEV